MRKALPTLKRLSVSLLIFLVGEAAGEGKAPYHRDGVHWSPVGHEIVAEALREDIFILLK